MQFYAKGAFSWPLLTWYEGPKLGWLGRLPLWLQYFNVFLASALDWPLRKFSQGKDRGCKQWYCGHRSSAFPYSRGPVANYASQERHFRERGIDVVLAHIHGIQSKHLNFRRALIGWKQLDFAPRNFEQTASFAIDLPPWQCRPPACKTRALPLNPAKLQPKSCQGSLGAFCRDCTSTFRSAVAQKRLEYHQAEIPPRCRFQSGPCAL